MCKSNRMWSEIRCFRDLSNNHWRTIRLQLNKRELKDLEQLKELFGCRQPTIDELFRIRSLQNRPQRVSGSVEKRFPQLLEWLGLKNDLSRAFDGGVYLGPSNGIRSIAYVGVGGDERIARWDGQSIDAFFPDGRFCLGCLEGLVLWTAVMVHGKPAFKNYPSVCEKCEGGYEVVAKAMGSRMGQKIGREEFNQIISSIAEHRRIEV